ncbi:hypothetical protein ACAX43_03715 [Paraburkholderia sp. IW21]|uniref:hypothetical protein n=1 Tax=Paraburkholderia sp. IW21 TaxID=3242488 RepID=UPI0035204E3E
MKITIYSEREHPVHIIVNRDTINDLQIETGATEELNALGASLNCANGKWKQRKAARSSVYVQKSPRGGGLP